MSDKPYVARIANGQPCFSLISERGILDPDDNLLHCERCEMYPAIGELYHPPPGREKLYALPGVVSPSMAIPDPPLSE